MSIDIHTNNRRVVEKPEITHQNRRAKLHGDVSLQRLTRNLTRCASCSHSQGVHTETGCAMDDCRCKSYRG